jgi:hypothetical protein
VTTFVAKGKRNPQGGDKIHLTVDETLWRRDLTSNDIVEVENPIDYRVTPSNVEPGIYDIQYVLKVKPEGTHLPLLITLNGKQIGSKIYNIPIASPHSNLELIPGDKITINPDRKSGQITENGGWCRINTPLNKIRGRVRVKVIGGSSGWHNMRIYTGATNPPGFSASAGNPADGSYNWIPSMGFYYNGESSKIKESHISLDSGSTVILSFAFTTHGIECYHDTTLQYTFTQNFDASKDYYLYPQGYQSGAKIEILS